MEITELKIFPIKKEYVPESGEKAYCVAIIDNKIKLSGLKIKEGKGGIYVSMPKVYKFIDKQAKKEFANRILATYVINHCMDEADNN